MRILKDALIILYVIIAIITTILLLSFNKYRVSVFGDYSIVIVDNNELEPSFSKGDMVIVKSSSMYRVGESIFFYNIVERKVEVTLANVSKVEEVTDGMSAYEIPGGSLVSHDEVIGSTNNVKVFHHIGTLLKFIESKFGYLILVVIPSGAALLYEIYNFIVIRKEEIEEEKAEQEKMKRLAKKRAKERLLARKQEAELDEEEIIEDEVEDIDEVEEEIPEEEEEQPKEEVKRDRESIRASIAQNKRAYEEKIQKLKSSYEKKVENHPEIDDDEDLKVTNQSNKVEKENDLKEKANDEAVNTVRRSSKVHTASVRRKIPTRVPTSNTKSTSSSASVESRKAPTAVAKAKAANEEKKEAESAQKTTSTTSATPVRKSNVVTAKKLAAIRAANAQKANNANTSESTAPKKTATPVRRGTRVQSKKIVSSRKVDEKD